MCPGIRPSVPSRTVAERCHGSADPRIVTYESIRAWVGKFGAHFAAELRRREGRPGRIWHLDEVFLKIRGEQVYLWRAVDEHGQVVDILVQEHRDADAAERFFRRLLDHTGEPPERIRTDKLASYAAAKKRLPELATVEHETVHSGAWLNHRVEQSHRPTRVRERRMQRFKSIDSAQRFLCVFSRFCNHLRVRRHLMSASAYRSTLRERFQSRREVADVCPAAA
jgi:putative transposase